MLAGSGIDRRTNETVLRGQCSGTDRSSLVRRSALDRTIRVLASGRDCQETLPAWTAFRRGDVGENETRGRISCQHDHLALSPRTE